MNSSLFSITRCQWSEASEALSLIRETVFIQEQKVPEELEWDGEDDHAIHLLTRDMEGKPIGCARILSDGHIGRMAVVKGWRNRGVGQALLNQAVDTVREMGCSQAFLDAQSYAIPFYEKAGFVASGDEFMDAGIPHRHMTLTL